MALNGQAGKAGLQNFGCLCGFPASSELSESRGPHAERLKMVGIYVQGFTRPGQRSIILSQQVVTECIHDCPLIARVAVAALRGL